MSETLNESVESSATESTSEFAETITYPSPAEDESQTSDETLNTDKPADEVETKEQDTKAEPEKKEETDKANKGDEFRFDKHPRWQEMKRKADRVEALENELGQLKNHILKNSQQAPAFKDVFKMPADQVREQFDDNPHDFLANFAKQIEHNALSKFSQQAKTEQERKKDEEVSESIRKTFDSFGEKNGDFWDMWDDGNGPLKKFMDENPGHNAMSAYHAMKAGENEKSIQKRVDAAVKEAEDRVRSEMIKNQKIKRHAVVLNSGPAAPTHQEGDAVLKNTKKYGGLTAVLTERLKARRGSA